MDLTPPSLTDSPYSPQCRSLDSPPFTSSTIYASAAVVNDYGYTPPPGLDSSCSLPTAFRSLIDPNLSQAGEFDNSPFAPLDSIPPSGAWPTPSTRTASPPPATASSRMSGLNPPSGYDHFGYDSSCLAAPVSPYTLASAYSRTASHSPAYMRTPPPSSTEIHGKEALASFSPRSAPSTVPEFGDPSSSSAPRASPSFLPIAGAPSYMSTPLVPNNMARSGSVSLSGAPMLLPDDLQTHVPTHPMMYTRPQSISSMSGETHLQGLASQAETPPPLPDAGVGMGTYAWPRAKKEKARSSRRHTTKEEANFQCKVKGCGKFFSRSYNFKSHMETHDEKREYPFPCQVPGCTKRFVRKTDLQRHHQSVHAKERNHACDYCGRMFARRDTLRRLVILFAHGPVIPYPRRGVSRQPRLEGYSR